MSRFVLLRHECPPTMGKPSHWDFMLECGDVLRTWELRELPTTWAKKFDTSDGGDPVIAIPLDDHRLAYLDFEGPVSGDRGTVQCCDRGQYTLVHNSSHSTEVKLQGEMLRDSLKLDVVDSTWQLSVR